MHTESILPSSWSLNIVFCTDSDSVLCNHHGSDHLSYPDHTLSCGNDWAASHPHKSENDLSSPCHWSVSLCYHGCHSRQFYSTLAWCNSEISWKGRNERIEFPNKIKILLYLSLFTGGGRGADWDGDLESKDRLRWPDEFSDLDCSLGESWPLVVSFLLLRSFVNTEEVVIFIRRNSWELSCGLRNSIPFSSNFSAIEIILRASCWSVGVWSEDREVKLTLPLPPTLPGPLSSVPLTTLSTTVSFSSRLSAFFPQFSLALSGGIPVPPLSTDQGAFPAGQGYSWI